MRRTGRAYLVVVLVCVVAGLVYLGASVADACSTGCNLGSPIALLVYGFLAVLALLLLLPVAFARLWVKKLKSAGPLVAEAADGIPCIVARQPSGTRLWTRGNRLTEGVLYARDNGLAIQARETNPSSVVWAQVSSVEAGFDRILGRRTAYIACRVDGARVRFYPFTADAEPMPSDQFDALLARFTRLAG